jgi:predicted HTH transcriptional regulator
MIAKRIEEIREVDLQALIANGVAEGRTIDYKNALPTGADESKRDFLADVSSFANTLGGDLVYGMDESGGLPASITPLAISDVDFEKQRLDSLIQSGISPRVRTHIHSVALENGDNALVVRIERSWSGPIELFLGGMISSTLGTRLVSIHWMYMSFERRSLPVRRSQKDCELFALIG